MRELFAGLVKKLSDDTLLFVVVDGLHLFTLTEDMEKKTQWITEVMEDMAWQATLKIVVTFCGVDRINKHGSAEARGLKGRARQWGGRG